MDLDALNAKRMEIKRRKEREGNGEILSDIENE